MFLEEQAQVLYLQEAKCETRRAALDPLHPHFLPPRFLFEAESLSVLAVALVTSGASPPWWHPELAHFVVEESLLSPSSFGLLVPLPLPSTSFLRLS